MERFANRRNTFVSFLLAAVVLVVVPSPAQAQVGVRGGVAVDPDMFYVGAHYETGPIVDRLHFRPNVEFGFNDDLTHIGLNFEFIYKVFIDNGWSFYPGVGPAINIYSFDDADDSDTEPGVNFLFGLEHSRGLFFEVKLGVLDSPNLKFGVGWTFR